MNVLRAVMVAFVLVAMSACGVGNIGSDPVETGVGKLPPPPQDLALDTVDPCQALTADQLQMLNVGGETFTPADFRRGPICQWGHFPDEPKETYLIELLQGQDIEVFLALSGNTMPTTVVGFPAVQTDFQGLGLPRPGSCTVLVGVAEGQTIQVSYSYSGSRAVTSEQSCAKARTAAEMAMQTLIDRMGGGR